MILFEGYAQVMFAKLKKRIQEESGVSGTEPGEKHPQFSGVEVAPATKSPSLSYVHNAGECFSSVLG